MGRAQREFRVEFNCTCDCLKEEQRRKEDKRYEGLYPQSSIISQQLLWRNTFFIHYARHSGFFQSRIPWLLVWENAIILSLKLLQICPLIFLLLICYLLCPVLFYFRGNFLKRIFQFFYWIAHFHSFTFPVFVHGHWILLFFIAFCVCPMSTAINTLLFGLFSFGRILFGWLVSVSVPGSHYVEQAYLELTM